MAESPIVTAPAPTDDHSDTFPASSAAEIQHEDPTSGLGVEASLVDSNRSGDGRQAAAGEHTSDLLLPRAELRKLREVDNQERDPDARLAMLIRLSLLIALVMPILLWCSRGEPLLLVWRLSLLLSAYFFLCASVLFVTKGLCVVVVNFSYGALLAYFADHVFGARIGMVVVYLNSVFTAGLAGYALAERRRSDGTERSADNVPVFSEKEEEYASNFVVFSAAMICVGLIVPTVYIAWVLLWHLTDYTVDEIVGDLSFAILAYLFFWTIFVTHHLLRGALIGEGNHFSTLFIVVTVVGASPVLFSIIFNNVAAMVVLWLGVTVLAVFFGYCLGVYSSYKQKMRSQLAVSPPDKLDDQNQAGSLQELAKSKDMSGDHELDEIDKGHTSSPPRLVASSSAQGSPPYIHPEEPILLERQENGCVA